MIPAAPTSGAIKIVTGFVLLLTVGFFLAAAWQPIMLLPAILLTAVVLGCYLFWTPVGYELTGDELTVFFRIGRKRYGPVLSCGPTKLQRRVIWRVFGNGGLFASSGIFWNRQFGLFRAYVTTGDPAHLVMVVTPKTKIILSPRDPGGFVVAPP